MQNIHNSVYVIQYWYTGIFLSSANIYEYYE